MQPYPLSPLQYGMLFHQIHSGAGSGVDVEQLEARLAETMDPARLEAAWNTVAARHDVLRTRFVWEGVEVPCQQVLPTVPVPFEQRDLLGHAPETQAAVIVAFLAEDRRRGFDLSEAPLWRVTLFRLAPAEFRMVWTYSHAILDSAFAEVLREVFSAYESLSRGEAVRLPERRAYRDHLLWLQQDLRERRDSIAAFWRDRLGGFTTPTSLRFVQRAVRPGETPDASHDTVRFRLSQATSDRIHDLASRHTVRPSTFVDAAWALVLAAFSGEDDIVFGVTRACRRSSIEGADDIIGLFINTVPMRVKLRFDASVLDLLRELRASQQALRPYEHTPLVDVIACAALPRDTPLFDTIIVFNDAENDARLKAFGESWARRDFELHDQTNFAMNVMAYDGPQLSFKLSYARSRFERATVERIAQLLTSLLDTMAANPEASLAVLPRQPEADVRRIAMFNDTTTAIDGPACLHEAVEAQADRTPENVALIFRDRSMSWRELDERANRVAHELISLGVGPGCRVGIFVERSLEMVVGLLGILKAGGAYVPMDPAYPRERIAWMLEDTGAPVVVTLGRLAGALPASQARALAIDGLGDERSASRPGPRATAADLAYVIFTSGSTGRPKGVEIEHRSVANFMAGMDRVLGGTPGVWLALTSISFDISVLELFWTLARGFTVVIQEEAEGARGAATAPRRTRPVGFSLFYFAADAGESGNRYRLLLEGAKFADTHDFEAVWTPERHFHAFGGLYPNPSVTSAAIAAITRRVGIRAGSVVLPLHNAIRCAEEWSVVDNLSNGRVGLSFASGWHASDFALAPANFKDRRELLARGIDTIRALWRGESVTATSGDGTAIQVRMFPPPVQREPRIWVTASGNPETFAMAGRMGACILTNLLVMKPEELVTNIALYRKAFREAGHEGGGHVTVMLHTFVGATLDEVRAKVRAPFMDYLRTSTDLINKARWELTAFAKADDRTRTGAAGMDLDDLSPDDMNALLDHAFERYFRTAGLFGTPETCSATVDRLREQGADEIACLIDFGVDGDSVLASLPLLDELRRRCLPSEGEPVAGEDFTIAAQIRRHGVTHLQCTPSLLGALLMDADAAAAIGGLQALLVGGEPLPGALVERLRPQFPATLRNMYGPTETTIWSTSTTIEPGARITLGKPIANTTLHIVDRGLRPVPLGVPGELLIGGAGVVRGYLARPELTTERFIGDAARNGSRCYRTGDLVRWSATGDVEFLGRLDHQVKLRGYRIELGEIESVLAQHPAVRDAVVVAREGASGDARLVAYVVPHSAAVMDDAGAKSRWKTLWDETYKDTQDAAAGTNTAGWNNSFTGLPFADSEIGEWADATAQRILSQAVSAAVPRPRVLEIGCGTGLLLFRVASRCTQYVGVDFSASALEYLQSRLAGEGLSQVSLERLAADELDRLAAPGLFDAIVINSVIQYFPDAAYLTRVLRAAYARLAPGGALFVGDVRSLAHLEAFHTAIETARSGDESNAAELAARVRRRIAEERELVLDPRYFDVVARELGDAIVERAEIKAGRTANEMTVYRYDVIVRKPATAAARPTPVPAQPCPAPGTPDALRALLRQHGAPLTVLGVRNARLTAGLEPDDLRTLDPRHDTIIEFSPADPALMDVTFFPRGEQPLPCTAARIAAPAGPAAQYANEPATAALPVSTLVPMLREHSRRTLPEYMVPSAFVVLDAMPLTPNGKVDRNALPAPDRVRAEATVRKPPENDVERHIVRVLQELLSIEDVGADDNFFDAGANSLMMVQASVRLRALLGRPVPLIRMFQHPTARKLAAALDDVPPAAEAAGARPGQDRAAARKEAMQRLRRGRQGGGSNP